MENKSTSSKTKFVGVKIEDCEKRPGKRVTVHCGPGRTKQSFKDECNVNNIMAKYIKTGLMPQRKDAIYGDFSDAGDYQEAQQRVLQANEDFMKLPSDVRKRFHNNPAELIAFCKDEKNLEEAVELGLIQKTTPKAVEPTKVENVNKVEQPQT